MPIFDKTNNALFESLGKSRQAVLGKKQVIPPPGALSRPGMKAPAPSPKAATRPTTTSVLERVVDDLLDVDGDPILVVDDELDVAAITPEDAVVEEPPTQILGVRSDTAVVFGIGLCLVVAIAYFAGRTTNKKDDAKTPPAAAILARPNQAPVEKAPPLQPPQQAPVEKADTTADDPGPVAQPAPPPAPKPAVVDGNWEIRVVTTNAENASKVAKSFNDDMMSPIYQKGLTAYVVRSGSQAQVRIKGFEKEDPAMLAAVQDSPDPTNNKVGAFKGAIFRKISHK